MNYTYIVFGAYGGIGSALCRRLAKNGATFMLAGRNEGNLADLAAELGAQKFALDATNLRMVESCMKQAFAHCRFNFHPVSNNRWIQGELLNSFLGISRIVHADPATSFGGHKLNSQRRLLKKGLDFRV